MRINKWIFAGSAVIAIIGVAMTMGAGYNSVVGGMGISLLAGSIVSMLTACLYYAYEWQGIVNSVRSVLPSLYTELAVIHRLTGEILPQVTKVSLLADLNYRRISGLASQAVGLVNGCRIDGFSGLRRNCRTEMKLQGVERFKKEIANLHSCVVDVELLSWSADCFQRELELKRANAWQVTPAEWTTLGDKRNLVNVRTAKVHEYEASLLIRLDELGSQFFSKKGESWDQIREIAAESIDEIVAKADYLDSL